MNIKRARPEIQKSRLENEVILAVVILYVLLSAVLLAIHHVQPDNVETQTSSTSPSHGEFATAPARPSSGTNVAPAPVALTDAHQLLTRAGFQEVRGLRAGGTGFQATAIKEGQTWEVEVDAITQQITRVPQAAH
jgi:hypothetical protein